MKLNPTQAALAVNVLAMLGLSAREAFTIAQPDENFSNGRVLAYNASQFAGNNPHEFLSNYAVRFTDPLQDALRAVRETLAPEVASNNSAFVEYPVYTMGDAYLALDQAGDARRAIGADYRTLKNVSKVMTVQRLHDTGLAVEVDEDEEALESDWQQRKVAWLLGILDRTELRTAVALYIASASNTAKTWDTTAGKDPDQDVMTIIDGMTVKPNNLIYGPGAWTKRSLSLRAQNLSGQGQSALLTPEQLGGLMNADVTIPRNRYATGASTASDVVGAYVMLFSSMKGMSRDDFSNLKTFTAGKRQVYVRQIGDKRWRVAVTTGKRLVALTSAVGAELITVS